MLAYPAVPVDLQTRNAANGPMVATILHAMLTQLRDESRAEKGPRALAELEVPVPSRFMAIAELESRGYEVKGDVATLRRNHPGLVNRLAEWINAEKVKIPPEATPAEFLDLAARALKHLPGWPSDTERVLRSLMRPGSATPPGGIPSAAFAPSIPAGPALPIAPRAHAPRASQSDWMKDFINAHTPPGGTKARPRLSAPPPAPKQPSFPSQSTTSRSEWMKDFGEPPAPAPAAQKAPAQAPAAKPAGKSASSVKPEPSAKPDWMSDFED